MKGTPESEMTRREPGIILVAEPNESARTLYVERILFFTNYRVVEARTGPDAMDRIRRHQPKVAVFATVLPDFEGWSAIRTLKRDPATRDIRVIVIGHRDDPHDRKLAADAGVDELLVPPFLPGELLHHVKRCMSLASSSGRTPATRGIIAPENRHAREPRAVVPEPDQA